MVSSARQMARGCSASSSTQEQTYQRVAVQFRTQVIFALIDFFHFRKYFLLRQSKTHTAARQSCSAETVSELPANAGIGLLLLFPEGVALPCNDEVQPGA